MARNTPEQLRRYSQEKRDRFQRAGRKEVRAWVPVKLVERLDAEASDREMTRGEAIEAALQAWIENK